MYRAYTTFITRLSPFVWSHRLEFPIVGGVFCCAMAVLLGTSIDLSLVGRRLADNINVVIFILAAFLMILVSLIWLTQVAGTISLPNSLTTSRYPILTVVAVSTMVLNVPPYIVSNLASISYSNTMNWPLFSSDQGYPWDLSGLPFGLSFISIAAVFSVLVRKIGAQRAIFSTFLSAAFGFIAFVLIVVVGEATGIDMASVGLNVIMIIWGVMVIVNVCFYHGWLFRFHDIWSGVSLFSFSFLPVFLAYVCAFRPRSLDFGVQMSCFGASLLLSEIVIAVMRRKRYLAI